MKSFGGKVEKHTGRQLTNEADVFEELEIVGAALQFKVSAFLRSDGATDVRRRNESDQWSQSRQNSRTKKSFASRTVFLCLATQWLQLQLVHRHRCWGIIPKKNQSCLLDHPRVRWHSDSDHCVAVLPDLGQPSLWHTAVCDAVTTPRNSAPRGRLVTFALFSYS